MRYINLLLSISNYSTYLTYFNFILLTFKSNIKSIVIIVFVTIIQINLIINCTGNIEKISEFFTNPFKSQLLINKHFSYNKLEYLEILNIYQQNYSDCLFNIYWVAKAYQNQNYGTHAHLVLINEQVIQKYETILSWSLTTTPNKIYGNYDLLTQNNFYGFEKPQFKSNHALLNPRNYFDTENNDPIFEKFLNRNKNNIKTNIKKSLDQHIIVLKMLLKTQ